MAMRWGCSFLKIYHITFKQQNRVALILLSISRPYHVCITLHVLVNLFMCLLIIQ